MCEPQTQNRGLRYQFPNPEHQPDRRRRPTRHRRESLIDRAAATLITLNLKDIPALLVDNPSHVTHHEQIHRLTPAGLLAATKAGPMTKDRNQRQMRNNKAQEARHSQPIFQLLAHRNETVETSETNETYFF